MFEKAMTLFKKYDYDDKVLEAEAALESLKKKK